ncbi:hypothetical protein Enr13x_43860 [Stieleria neptunia]|uniref:Uncharacterized protein n=1 Tax=Stieleria neptunia TaxID=2527979 RepID=A0A518HUJ7_9BACT|nr:hypothetical protein [Stieleria neptunia]QDV44520.1 hypothetical protein Enr13x_43860 [Stieleria neptunia]
MNMMLRQLNRIVVMSLAAFAEYLGTLGLRSHDGKAKPAWNRLRESVAKRAR